MMLPIAMLPLFRGFTGGFMLRIGNVLGLIAIILSVLLWFGIVVKWQWEAWNSLRTRAMFQGSPSTQPVVDDMDGSRWFFVTSALGIVLFPVIMEIVNSILGYVWP